MILTQDRHTPGHVSFASAHPGKRPFETAKLDYGVQVLGPDHCVQGTPGADFHKDLRMRGRCVMTTFDPDALEQDPSGSEES